MDTLLPEMLQECRNAFKKSSDIDIYVIGASTESDVTDSKTVTKMVRDDVSKLIDNTFKKSKVHIKWSPADFISTLILDTRNGESIVEYISLSKETYYMKF